VSTKTVLVFGQGAVIRLNESVAPGQMLRLTNEKTKKEVACQVVKSKNERTMNGYVELKFTEPAAGFWGMRFPGEFSVGPARESAMAITNVEPDRESSKVPHVEASPVEEDFKTELKIDDHSGNKAELLASGSDPATEALKIENSRLQEQLSSLLFAEAPQSAPSSGASKGVPEKEFAGAAAKLLEMASADEVPKDAASKKESATPGATLKSALTTEKSTLKVEEVKVPAWLEPLTRNVSAQQSSTSEVSKKDAAPKPSEVAFESQEALATPPKREAAVAKPAAVFGRTLLDGASPMHTSRGGNKGLWAAAIAAAVLVSAASVTWYLRQSASSTGDRVSASALAVNATAASKPPAAEAAPAPAEAQTQADASAPASQTSVPANQVTRGASEAAVSVASQAEVKPQPAVISERIPKTNAVVDTGAKAGAKTVPAVDAQPEPSKPSLGAVRLAKPKVGRGSRAVNGAVPEPELDGASDAVLPSDGALGGLVGAGGEQPAAPAAPLPVGGEVKTARMISSVPPTYPPMAKAQRVSGDVRIDALIDASGRVSSMKVVSGPSLLHQAAMEALRQWKYQPATLDGKPVAMHLTVTIQFRLQ